MLVIRFLRTGKRNQPFFRIIVTDKKNPPRGGRFLEILGFFNPLTKENKIKKDRVKHWLSIGAQPSDRVHNLLVKEGIVEGKKIDVHKKPKKKTEATEDKKEEKIVVGG
ncbi:MAG: 30S ribosomal protein S16 [Patescibacteria group bacterium]|nr:30S ribosomal protein S16 [Patescibacteria group bacterium]